MGNREQVRAGSEWGCTGRTPPSIAHLVPTAPDAYPVNPVRPCVNMPGALSEDWWPSNTSGNTTRGRIPALRVSSWEGLQGLCRGGSLWVVANYSPPRADRSHGLGIVWASLFGNAGLRDFSRSSGGFPPCAPQWSARVAVSVGPVKRSTSLTERCLWRPWRVGLHPALTDIGSAHRASPHLSSPDIRSHRNHDLTGRRAGSVCSLALPPSPAV